MLTVLRELLRLWGIHNNMQSIAGTVLASAVWTDEINNTKLFQ